MAAFVYEAGFEMLFAAKMSFSPSPVVADPYNSSYRIFLPLNHQKNVLIKQKAVKLIEHHSQVESFSMKASS